MGIEYHYSDNITLGLAIYGASLSLKQQFSDFQAGALQAPPFPDLPSISPTEMTGIAPPGLQVMSQGCSANLM
ncbi:hypothetical protein [Tropicibacter oceani]|uniref:Uncharacterized protein n=1 Tax=Tropicibacter oceani TaxID=3058420 RepID=A0ABY8QFT0_9RHOB|nr:hypothetical protein [Tropicibacter oceani]WGW03470.1 hypothetical protein QF118_16315 [Tropicibacter oceani]